MAFYFGEGHRLALQMFQQANRPPSLLAAGGDQQTVAAIVDQPDITRATLQQAGGFPPTGRKLGLAFFSDRHRLQLSHKSNISLHWGHVKAFRPDHGNLSASVWEATHGLDSAGGRPPLTDVGLVTPPRRGRRCRFLLRTSFGGQAAISKERAGGCLVPGRLGQAFDFANGGFIHFFMAGY